MKNYVDDDQTTAAVTASKMHVGEVPVSGRRLAKRDLDREAHNARMEGNRWGATLKLLIGLRNDLRNATDPDSLFPGRNDEACVAVLKRAASAIGPSISEAIQRQRDADDLADECHMRLIALEADACGELPGPTNIEMHAMLQADNDQKRAAIADDGCCGGTAMADGICFGIGPCPRHNEIQLCSRFCERLIAWTNELENQPQTENLE